MRNGDSHWPTPGPASGTSRCVHGNPGTTRRQSEQGPVRDLGAAPSSASAKSVSKTKSCDEATHGATINDCHPEGSPQHKLDRGIGDEGERSVSAFASIAPTVGHSPTTVVASSERTVRGNGNDQEGSRFARHTVTNGQSIGHRTKGASIAIVRQINGRSCGTLRRSGRAGCGTSSQRAAFVANGYTTAYDATHPGYSSRLRTHEAKTSRTVTKTASTAMAKRPVAGGRTLSDDHDKRRRCELEGCRGSSG